MRAALTELSDDERMFQGSVRQFAAERVAPLVRAMDEAQQMDPGLVREMFALGLMGIVTPEEFGGAGGSFFDAVLAVEAISAVDPAVGVLVDVQNTLCTNAIIRWGTSEQKRRYLPRLAAEMVGAYALSEAKSGSDAFALETRAVRRGDDYVLNGQKLWITNAKEAGAVYRVRDDRSGGGIQGRDGVSGREGNGGIRSGAEGRQAGDSRFEHVRADLPRLRGPAGQMLGEPGKGYRIAIETLNEGRIGIGAQMVGLADGAWGHAARWAKERKQFGKPLAEFQAMQFQLAEMATDVEAARLMVYNAARLRDRRVEFVKEAAMAKYFASQVAERVASLAVEVFGGSGFVKDYPVEKLYRDAKIGKIYEGTSFMQLATIAKLALGKI